MADSRRARVAAVDTAAVGPRPRRHPRACAIKTRVVGPIRVDALRPVGGRYPLEGRARRDTPRTASRVDGAAQAARIAVRRRGGCGSDARHGPLGP